MGVFSLGGWSRRIHAGFLVSRATQDTDRVRVGFAYGGLTLCAGLFHVLRLPTLLPTSRSYNPGYCRNNSGLGCSAFARHYLRNHFCFLLLGVLRCFSSPRSPHPQGMVPAPLLVGFPIRKSPDQVVFADPRGLSQLITSFFASMSQGIHPSPFSRFSFTLGILMIPRFVSRFLRLSSMSKITGLF